MAAAMLAAAVLSTAPAWAQDGMIVSGIGDQWQSLDPQYSSASKDAQILGDVPPAPALAGYALGCSEPAALAARCSKAGMKVEGNVVRLPAALGGSWLLESSAKEEDA